MSIIDPQYQRKRRIARSLIWLALASVGACSANASTLMGYGTYNGSSSTDVWSIDAATGQTSVAATSIPCNPFQGNFAAFDSANRILYMAGASVSSTALCSINLTSGATSSIVEPFGSPVSDEQMFFDSGSGKLFGYGGYNGSSSTDVWSINPATGQTNVVATSVPCNPFLGEYAAFNPATRVLYMAGTVSGGGTALCSTNLVTGVTTDITGPSGSPVSDQQIFFDTGTGSLYGYGTYNGSNSTDVWSINPVTGLTSVIATSIPCNPFLGAYAAFDPTSRVLYIAGAMAGGTALCSTNLATGVTTNISGTFGSPVSDEQLFLESGSSVPEVPTLFLVLSGLSWITAAGFLRPFRRRPSFS